jgi:hypothetical protein
MKGIILIILNYFFDVIHQNRHFLRQLPEEKKNLEKIGIIIRKKQVFSG